MPPHPSASRHRPLTHGPSRATHRRRAGGRRPEPRAGRSKAGADACDPWNSLPCARIYVRTPTTLRIGSPAPRARIAMLPQPGGECAVAVPPGSVPARQRWPHPASCRIIEAHRAAEAGPGAGGPPRARAPATRPPAVPGRLLQAALLCHRRDGTPRMLTAHQATAGAGAVRTRLLTGPGGVYGSAAGTAGQATSWSHRRVRACRAAVRAGGGGERASEVRWALWPPRPPHCARRSGTGPGDRTLASAVAAGSSQPTVPDGSMECDCARARRPVRSPAGRKPARRTGRGYGTDTVHP